MLATLALAALLMMSRLVRERKILLIGQIPPDDFNTLSDTSEACKTVEISGQRAASVSFCFGCYCRVHDISCLYIRIVL